MTLHVALNHLTHYRYDRRVQLGPQVVRLRPAPHWRTPVPCYSLKVVPKDHFINWQQDPQATTSRGSCFPRRSTELRVEVDLVAEMAVLNPFDFFLEPDGGDTFRSTTSPSRARSSQPYLVNDAGAAAAAEVASRSARARAACARSTSSSS